MAFCRNFSFYNYYQFIIFVTITIAVSILLPVLDLCCGPMDLRVVKKVIATGTQFTQNILHVSTGNLNLFKLQD